MESRHNRMAIVVGVILAAAFIVMSGCAGEQRLEVSLGHNLYADKDWRGGANATFELRHTFTESETELLPNFCSLRHVSHLFAGAPFNTIDETWYNELACGYSFDL